MIYRKELDGLRALAVLSVIIYHANMQIYGIDLFKGGFFGVDIFFVLSGYLITGIVRSQMELGTFSLINFYWRRIKRIVPALLIVLAVTSALAYLILLPNDLITYAESLQSALYFGSNHYFYNEESYTAPASIYKPLLHTWSLAVEWQFYLIFPIVIWFINRFFKKYQFGLLFALALLSLQYANLIVANHPDMAFYLLPARSWELLLGGLVTFYNRDNLLKATVGSLESFIYKALPMLGLYLIMYSLIIIDHNVAHPSFITIIPVLGTCLIIMFTHKGEVTNDTLSLRPFVFIGLISYPLYLWHQPIFVFFRFLKHDHFRYEQLLLLIITSALLAFLTYNFIEKKYKGRETKVKHWIFLVFVLMINVTFTYYVEKTNGFPSRLGDYANVLKNLNDNKLHQINGSPCHNRDFETSCVLIGGNNKSKNLLLLGDSHAGMLGRHVYELAKKRNWSYTNFSSSSCSGIEGLTSNRKDKAGDLCNQNIVKIAKYLENKENPRFDIIYSIRHARYFTNENKVAQKIIKDKLELWMSLGHNITLVYDIYSFPYSVPQEINKKLVGTLPSNLMDKYRQIQIKEKYSNYLKQTKYANIVFDSINGNNLSRVYPDEVLCNKEWCVGNDSKHIFYYDENHLSTHGAKLVIDQVALKIK